MSEKYIPHKSDLITIDEKRGIEIVTPRPDNKYQKQFIDLFSDSPKITLPELLNQVSDETEKKVLLNNISNGYTIVWDHIELSLKLV